MHCFTLRSQHRSIITSALVLLFISQHVNAQQNLNIDKVQVSASTTLPTYDKTLPIVSVQPSVPPPVTVAPTVPPPPVVTGPITQPPLLASVPVPPPQATAAATAAETPGICATPLEFLQCRDNASTFLAAMQAAGLNNFLTSRTAVQTIFVPTNAAFAALLQSQGLTAEQLLQNTATLKYVLQNHILPNVEVRVADMKIGASWATINPNQQLTVQSPVAPAIANGDLRACNTLIQEVNVVPAGAFPAAATGVATTAAVPVPVPVPVPAPAPVPVTIYVPVATTAATPATQVVAAKQVATTTQQATAPVAYSTNVDITKINANFDRGLNHPFG